MLNVFLDVALAIVLCMHLFSDDLRLIDAMYGKSVKDTKFLYFTVGVILFFMLHSIAFTILSGLILLADFFELINWKKYNWIALNEKVEADLSK